MYPHYDPYHGEGPLELRKRSRVIVLHHLENLSVPLANTCCPETTYYGASLTLLLYRERRSRRRTVVESPRSIHGVILHVRHYATTRTHYTSYLAVDAVRTVTYDGST